MSCKLKFKALEFTVVKLPTLVRVVTEIMLNSFT